MDANLHSLISVIATRHHIPPELARAIVAVESGGNPYAMRYEPAFYERYIRGKGYAVPRQASRPTEEIARATSYGLMQVMGQVAREQGYVGPYLSELCDVQIGLEYGCQVLDGHSRALPAPQYGWDAVCAAYNGGRGAVKSPGVYSNPEYPAKVLAALGGNWPQRG